MQELHDLKDRLLQELEEYGTKELSAGTLDVVDKLSHAIKNLCKIIEMSEEEYSGAMRYDRSMMRDGGSYARGRRGNVKRDAIGRYSRDAADLADKLRDLMADAPDEQIRHDMERLLLKIER